MHRGFVALVVSAQIITAPTAVMAQPTTLPSSDSSGPQTVMPDPARDAKRQDGVIPPPAKVDPGMHVPAPHDGGTMPVIKPPGTATTSPKIIPK